MGRRGVISHRDFVRDLGRGAYGEDIVQAFFRREFGVVAENVSERNPDFDLRIDRLDPEVAKQPKVIPRKLLRKVFRDLGFPKHTEITVEVKFDEAASRYKNFFLEVFFDVDRGIPGAIFKCKADLMAWVVPFRGGRYQVFLFNRPALLAWFFRYLLENKKNIVFKTPGISPQARGVAIPIKEVSEGAACLGVYLFRL